MSRNGSGTYTLPANSFSNPVAGTTVDAEDADETLTDIETALTASIAKDGQTVTTSAIPFAAGIQVDTIAEKTAATGVTIDSVLLKDGGGTFTAPIIISGAAAGQIVFPASQNASSNANTLDDYEEGTWTPAIAFGGASVGVTYTTQLGRYTKIGHRVFVDFEMVLSNNGSSAGAVTITGLPFTNNGTLRAYGHLALESIDLNAASGYTHVIGRIATGATAITVLEIGDNVSSAALTDADVPNTGEFSGSFTYTV